MTETEDIHRNMKRMIIRKNCIRCRQCGDVIVSRSVHDFKFCKCGTVAMDGGNEYLRRCFKNGTDDFEELSEYEYEPDESEPGESAGTEQS